MSNYNAICKNIHRQKKVLLTLSKKKVCLIIKTLELERKKLQKNSSRAVLQYFVTEYENAKRLN